jgi:cobalt-precorrin-7 (C5)-methyltransferase
MAKTQSHKLTIVGCGPGSPDYLTEAGRRAIANATVLVGSPSLLDRYATPTHQQIRFGSDIESVIEAIASRCENEKITILVSGDPGLCSLARPVIRRFGRDTFEVLPGISSVQLAFARLGLDWLDTRIVSAHNCIPDLTPADLAASGNIAILAGHRQSQGWIADLADAFGNERFLVVCEDLSLQSEKIHRVSVSAFRQLRISTRSVVLLLKEDAFR